MISKRIEWVDLAKGLTILLVIAGHTITTGIIRGAIFSFHMPLFFFMSGVTYKVSQNTAVAARRSYRMVISLIVPAVVLFLIRTAAFRFTGTDQGPGVRGIIKAMIFASGTPVRNVWATAPVIGAVWFMFAFTLSRTLYDIISLRLRTIWAAAVSAAVSVAGVVISRYMWLPLSADIAMAAVGLMMCGRLIRRIVTDDVKKNILIGIIAAIIWAVSFIAIYHYKNDFLDMSGRRYPLYPVCFLTSFCAMVSLSCFCSIAARIGIIKTSVGYLGRNSLILFFVHYMDRVWQFVWKISSGRGIVTQFENTLVRILVDLIIFAAVMAVITLVKKKRATSL